jgi:hypothetical protein
VFLVLKAILQIIHPLNPISRIIIIIICRIHNVAETLSHFSKFDLVLAERTHFALKHAHAIAQRTFLEADKEIISPMYVCSRAFDTFCKYCTFPSSATSQHSPFQCSSSLVFLYAMHHSSITETSDPLAMASRTYLCVFLGCKLAKLKLELSLPRAYPSYPFF